MSLFIYLFSVLMSFQVNANVVDSINNTGAEVNALAGAGGAYVGGIANSINNPAALAKIKQYNAELSTSAGFTYKKAPANGADTASTSTVVAPSLFIGGAYRLTDYLAAGFTLDTPASGGTKFSDINYGIPGLQPRELYLAMYVVEFGPALAFKLPHNIDIGISYRMDYANETVKMYDTGTLTYNTASLTGTAFSGFKLGVQYKPIDRLYFGFSYRSPVNIKTTGSMRVYNPADDTAISMDISSICKFADRFIFSTAYQVFPDKWMLSFDYEYNLYSNYSAIVIDTPAGAMNLTSLNKNRSVIRLGSDYKISPTVPFRAGFAYFTNYENRNYFSALSTGSPASTWMLTFGTGFTWSEKWAVNLAYSFLYNSGSIPNPAPSAESIPGNYRLIINGLTVDLLFNM